MYVNRHAFITSGRLTLCRGWLLMYAGAFICSARDPAYCVYYYEMSINSNIC
jgi:hypothetical protein